MVVGENDPEGTISISTEDRSAEISKENEFKRGVASWIKAQTLNTNPVRERFQDYLGERKAMVHLKITVKRLRQF